jgi:hypothetical protein
VSAGDAAAALDRLKGLVGGWRGRRPDGREVGVAYRLTAGSSALVETWDLGPGREALTVYHRDGGELVASHFCPQGNQPRLRMTKAAADRFDFAFMDATGIEPGQAVQRLFWIELGPDATLTRGETYADGDREETETITYRRVD